MSALLLLPAALFLACQAGLLALTGHRAWTVLRLWKLRQRREAPLPEPPPEWPSVTVQLPVFNERRVVARLIAAAGNLDYPRERLQIQVLDDSTDDTRERVDRAVERLRARGLDARVLRRAHRRGFKAGALAEGLASAKGEWIAIFDADFVPDPDFLRRLIPHGRDPRVGMVQARWGHLHREQSLLTATQALMLDAHFRVDQHVRMACGLFFSFNGTAGVWRRACIEDAGGWSHETLTEDLDLSYRAQLRGWRFVYDGRVEAKAELPADLDAFRAQQRRWTKGSIQTARKILPRLGQQPLPARQRIEAVAHLLGNASYPLLLVLSVLLGPLLLVLPPAPRIVAVAAVGLTLAFGLVPVVVFLAAGQRGLGRPAWRIAAEVLAALVMGAGLSVGNGRAALEGLGRRTGDWERTPKVGSRPVRAGEARYVAARRGRAGEVLMAFYVLGSLGAAALARRFDCLPFLALLFAGSAWVGLGPRSQEAGAKRGTIGKPAA